MYSLTSLTKRKVMEMENYCNVLLEGGDEPFDIRIIEPFFRGLYYVVIPDLLWKTFD